MADINLVRQSEAQAYYEHLPEGPTRWVVGRLFVIIMKRLQKPETQPITDLDLKFLYEVAAELVENPDELRRVMAGENVGAWDDH